MGDRDQDGSLETREEWTENQREGVRDPERE